MTKTTKTTKSAAAKKELLQWYYCAYFGKFWLYIPKESADSPTISESTKLFDKCSQMIFKLLASYHISLTLVDFEKINYVSFCRNVTTVTNQLNHNFLKAAKGRVRQVFKLTLLKSGSSSESLGNPTINTALNELRTCFSGEASHTTENTVKNQQLIQIYRCIASVLGADWFAENQIIKQRDRSAFYQEGFYVDSSLLERVANAFAELPKNLTEKTPDAIRTQLKTEAATDKKFQLF